MGIEIRMVHTGKKIPTLRGLLACYVVVGASGPSYLADLPLVRDLMSEQGLLPLGTDLIPHSRSSTVKQTYTNNLLYLLAIPAQYPHFAKCIQVFNTKQVSRVGSIVTSCKEGKNDGNVPHSIL